LRFSKVVGEAADKIASLGANLIGMKSFFHMEAFDGIAPEVLDGLPKLDSTSK